MIYSDAILFADVMEEHGYILFAGKRNSTFSSLGARQPRDIRELNLHVLALDRFQCPADQG